MTPKPDATDAVKKNLATFLKANMPSLKQALTDWPAPNQELSLPSLTLFTRSPSLSLMSPYTIWKGTADEAGVVPYRRVIGMWDFSLQLDIWVPYKTQRGTLLEELVRAFTLDPVKIGLNIQMADYFDQWVTYSLSGEPQFVDEEQGSQRNEWRVLVPVSANCRAVREYSGYLIETIENQLETTTGEIAAPEEPDDSTTIL